MGLLSLVENAFGYLPNQAKITEAEEIAKLRIELEQTQQKLAELNSIATLFRPITTLASPKSGISEKTAPPDDSKLVRRLLDSYNRSLATHRELGQSVWTAVVNPRLRDLQEVFMEGSVEKAAHYLRDPSISNLFYGFDSLCLEFSNFYCDPNRSGDIALTSLAGLVRFAESLGVVRLFNPEPHGFCEPPIESEDVIQAIENRIGIKMAFPNPYPNEPGLCTETGIASYRAIQALYQAWRIKEMLRDTVKPRVLEIGAGLGRTAYYARALGITDYTIVDVPMTCISQGYFLGRTIGEDAIVLLGEQPAETLDVVKIISPSQFLESDERYDLIVNVDSLTEMHPSISDAYWNKIVNSSDCLLSINHEGNSNTVFELISSEKKVSSVHREMYWMRNGYIEETVSFG